MVLGADLVNVFEVFLPQLLLYPNPTDPLNGEAAALLMREPETYKKKVRGAHPCALGKHSMHRPCACSFILAGTGALSSARCLTWRFAAELEWRSGDSVSA